jgi:hypothetical protein
LAEEVRADVVCVEHEQVSEKCLPFYRSRESFSLALPGSGVDSRKIEFEFELDFLLQEAQRRVKFPRESA